MQRHCSKLNQSLSAFWFCNNTTMCRFLCKSPSVCPQTSDLTHSRPSTLQANSLLPTAVCAAQQDQMLRVKSAPTSQIVHCRRTHYREAVYKPFAMNQTIADTPAISEAFARIALPVRQIRRTRVASFRTRNRDVRGSSCRSRLPRHRR